MILIIDDMPIFREPIAACLKLAGYETICAGDGLEGLKLARNHLPEMILLDMAMPGMDGIQVLQRLRGEPRTASTPVLMLTAVADRDRVIQAIQSGAQEYLLKSRFTTKDLLARIEKHLRKTTNGQIVQKAPATSADSNGAARTLAVGTATPVPVPVPAAVAVAVSKDSPPVSLPTGPLVDGEKCIQRIRKATSGKALSGVVAEVIATAASSRSDSAELAKLVSSDPVLTARVLKAANSPAYASKSGVCTTVAEAVRKVGFSGVRNITAAVGIFDSMPAGTADGFNPLRYWLHSVAVAQLSESLISEKIKDTVSPGHAYICGLCHDLGEILVRCEFDEELRQILEAERQTRRPREDIQTEMLGLSHDKLVLEALRAIGLPTDICEPIENFHAGKTSAQKAGLMPGILWMADRYANGLLLTAEPESKVELFDRSYVRSVLGSDGFKAPDAETFCSQVRNLTSTLARLGRNEEAQLLVPIYQKAAAKRVWIARDPMFSECDPIYCAMAQLSDAKAYPRLPSVGEHSTYDYLMVIARNPTITGFTEESISQRVATRNGPCPVLWLVSDAEGIRTGKALSPVQMPVQLGDLATFLGPE
jgi:HD-like signal output (HDOD) protein/CheY-like chemotaxis protein